MHPRQVQREPVALGQRVAHAAAEHIDQNLFRVAIGRKVDPLDAPALPAVILEGGSQRFAPRVDDQIAGFQEQLERVEPIVSGRICPRQAHAPHRLASLCCKVELRVIESSAHPPARVEKIRKKKTINETFLRHRVSFWFSLVYFKTILLH
jgi:hypothetical protein